MIRVVRDLLILLAICLFAGMLCRLRLHTRQLEQNRAELIYTVDIPDAEARTLMTSLENHGFLNGIPRTYWVGRNKDIYELRVVTNPAILANPRVKSLLHEGFRSVCQAAFPGKQAMVKLADTRLNTFHLLIEPQAF